MEHGEVRTPDRSTWIGSFALAHPVVAIGLIVWLVNDHVLKDAYGSWWTGKLTDVVALVVFPVLVAAALERVVARPIAVALAFTAAFYGSINLFPAADAATEWVMSLVIDSSLTRDPTDLLVLPAMAGAWWVWNRPTHSRTELRRRWGRVIFVVGVGTTLATSPDTAQSETFSGTVVLTEEQPSITIPYSVRIDGDQAAVGDFWAMPRIAARSFAAITPGTPLVEGALVDSTTVQLDDGSWNLMLTLEDPAFAPAEVQWSFSVQTEGSGGLFFGDEAPVPVLSLASPADETGPTPLASLSLPEATPTPVRAWEWIVTAPSDGGLAVSVPRGAQIDRLLVGTIDGEIELRTGFLTQIPTPSTCVEDPCTFSVWATTSEYSLDFAIEFYGPADAVIESPTLHRMVATTQTFVTDTVSSDVPVDVDLMGTLQLPELADPIDGLTRLVELDAETTVEEDDDDFWWGASAGFGGDYLGRPAPMPQCCDPVMLVVFFNSRNDRFERAETAAEVTVTVWSLQALDPNEITLTFDQ